MDRGSVKLTLWVNLFKLFLGVKIVSLALTTTCSLIYFPFSILTEPVLGCLPRVVGFVNLYEDYQMYLP